MAKSYNEYTADGSTNQFNLTFPYLLKAHVSVSFDGVAQAFSWVNDTRVQTTTTPAAGVSVRVARSTPTSPLQVYPPASTLKGVTLNGAQLQYLYCVEEISEALLETDPDVARVIRAPTGTAVDMTTPPVASLANHLLAFNADGTPKATTFSEHDIASAVSMFMAGPANAASKCIYLSAAVANGQTLEWADTTASVLGGVLVIDTDYTLTANTSLLSKEIVFAGGLLTLGTFNLTFNKNTVLATGVRLWNSTGTGKVKGTIAGSICIDWWGTTSTSTADSATTVNGNDCWTYTVQSANPRARVYFTKSDYYLSDSWVKGESFYCPEIEGCGANLNYAFGTAKAALVLIGGSGYPTVQGHVAGLTFNGNTTAIGLELRGQCGVVVRNCVFETNGVGLLLHNATTGMFSEFNVWRDCAFRSSKVWWYYKRTSGNDSFHGSGPDGNVICNDNAPTQARIVADASTSIYNIPLSFTAFPTTSTVPLISLGSGTVFLPKQGTIGIENSGYTGAIKILQGGSRANGCVSVSCWGGDFDLGDLVLMDTMNLKSDGVVYGRTRPRSFDATRSGGTFTVANLARGRSSNFMLDVSIVTSNYYWVGLVVLGSNPFSAFSARALITQSFGGSLYGTYGDPVFGWDGTNFTVHSTSSNWSDGAVSVQATDMGATF